MPARSAVQIYDAVARWRGWPPTPTDLSDPVEADAVVDSTPMAGGHGILAPGEVTIIAGRTAPATALAFNLACDIALRASDRRPPSGVLMFTRDAPESVALRMAHALARLPLHSTRCVDELELAADVLSQQSIWIECVVAGAEGAVERMRRSIGGVPIRLHLVADSSLVTRVRTPLASVVMAMKAFATRTSSAVLLNLDELREEAAWRLADTCIELIGHEGEVRPRVLCGPRVGDLLPLRLARGWSGFEELPDPDAEILAESFYAPATR